MDLRGGPNPLDEEAAVKSAMALALVHNTFHLFGFHFPIATWQCHLLALDCVKC